jgi:hypothetical protein
LRRPRLVALVLLSLSGAAAAQERIEIVQELDFDRPEAWGMKFAAAVTAFTPLAPPAPRVRGEVEVAVEGASVPSLSTEERRIGFVGTKVEDIDRAPAFVRFRASFGLGAASSLELGVVPPVELDGLEPRYLALALARPLLERGRLQLGGRIGVQAGRLAGDITCSRADVAAGDDPTGNPFGCAAPSEDELETLQGAVELVAARRPGREGGFEPFAAFALHRLDGRFQVDAYYRGVVDRSRLETAGTFWSAAIGAAGAIAPGWRLAGELFYAPLDIRRPGRGVENEPVLNFRLQLAHRLR